MAKTPKTNKILITECVLRQYIESSEGFEVSRPMFQEYLKLGLPVCIIKGKYHGHSDNIDDFFKRLTHRQRLDQEVTENTDKKNVSM